MALDDRRFVVWVTGTAVWVAPKGTPRPGPGEFVDERWDLADPAPEAPDAPDEAPEGPGG